MAAKTMSLKKNGYLTVDIEDITDLGFGVAKHEGIVVFVADTVPQDRARVKVIKVNSSYAVARCEELLVPSPLRVADRCGESACRACAYKCISYTEELRRKEEGVRRLFAPLGITTLPILPSVKEKRYRNKAQYPISFADGKYSLGFFAPKSHRVTPVGDCPLTPPVFSEICAVLLDFFARHGLTVYDEQSGEGLLRHVYLRRGELSHELLVTLVINGTSLPHSAELTDELASRFPDTVGILLNVNRENTNVILGDEYITLFGRDHIYDTLAGVRLKITAPAFYQVNHDTAELLYREAARLASPRSDDVLLDLYCGAGSIGLSMAESVRELIGIEIVDSAVECARENAAANGASNAHFFTGDAKNTERLLEHAEAELGRRIEPDVIILDPPRGGCDESLISFASSLSPRKIVYISCNPKTLARDVKSFAELGYVTDSVLPVDMFPGTGHVESVVCLQRQTN